MAERAYTLYLEGTEAIKSGDLQRAASLLNESLTGQPHAKTAERLAYCLRQLGRPADALRVAGFAYALNPRHDQSAMLFAELLSETGERRRARSIALETITRNPRYRQAERSLEESEANP